jgi:hypothetical protein
MNRIFAGKIQADHGQFLIYAAGSGAGEALPDWTEEEHGEKGYMANGSAIGLLVYGGTSLYWLEVYLHDNLPTFEECDRVLAFNLEIASGKLIISDIFNACSDEGAINLLVEAGSYVVYILGYNLVYGNDIYDGLFTEMYKLSAEELDKEIDRELEKRTDIERYEIILVSGKTQIEGAIKGENYMGGIEPDRHQ